MTLPSVIVALALLLCAADGGALAKARKAQPQPRYPAGAYAADRKLCQLFYARAVKAEQIEEEGRRLKREDVPIPFPWTEKASPTDPIKNVTWAPLNLGEDRGIIQEVIRPYAQKYEKMWGAALDKEAYAVAQKETKSWQYTYEQLDFDLDGNGKYDDVYAFRRFAQDGGSNLEGAYDRYWVVNIKKYWGRAHYLGGYAFSAQLFISNGVLYHASGYGSGGSVTAMRSGKNLKKEPVVLFEEICRW